MTASTSTLRPGLRLASAVCTTEIIVVRPGAGAGRLCCGGAPMHERGTVAEPGARPEPGRMGGSTLGKRYTSPTDSSLEVMVTAAGEGALSLDADELVLKDAAPLPASD